MVHVVSFCTPHVENTNTSGKQPLWSWRTKRFFTSLNITQLCFSKFYECMSQCSGPQTLRYSLVFLDSSFGRETFCAKLCFPCFVRSVPADRKVSTNDFFKEGRLEIYRPLNLSTALEFSGIPIARLPTFNLRSVVLSNFPFMYL